jgi:hypothetical protein
MVAADKNYVLVKLDKNYADEFDVEAFVVVTDTYLEAAKASILKNGREAGLHMNFGTNEWLEWGSGEELVAGLDVTPLTTAEAQFLARAFPIPRFDTTEGVVAGHSHYRFLSQAYPGPG